MTALLYGMITAGFLTAAMFFFRFWRRTGDILFMMFGFAFLLLALNQALVAVSAVPGEGAAWLYLPKLLAFALLIVGIVGKNRRDMRNPGP